ncbi:fasciclin domain-containing protein [Methylococcus mesophilus]|uniref:fasciclin domain-containing protein n=1 Tax=Methylococcus mesophilus TaxID=2993564 RepID=UPI00224B1797|nr:fasciclin domain-containing protein [Methylococcus mesophilus]UZR30437.1 fasciclin domain-containing protein [Methylococcus mesophilus]
MKFQNALHGALIATAAAMSLLSVTPANAAATPEGYAKCRKLKLVDYPGTIVDAAVATPQLSTLVSLVTAANLAQALSEPGPFTVYAPTDEAFGKVPPAVLNAIGSNSEVLSAVLTYHVTPGKADPRKSVSPREIKTLQGQTVFFHYDGGPQINQSAASCQGVRTTNGIVWLIDSVLLPQFK